MELILTRSAFIGPTTYPYTREGTQREGWATNPTYVGASWEGEPPFRLDPSVCARFKSFLGAG